MYFVKIIKMNNHNLIQSPPKVKQKIHVSIVEKLEKMIMSLKKEHELSLIENSHNWF